MIIVIRWTRSVAWKEGGIRRKLERNNDDGLFGLTNLRCVVGGWKFGGMGLTNFWQLRKFEFEKGRKRGISW